MDEHTDEPMWTRRDGSEIPISEMSFTHLMNAMGMISRNIAQALLTTRAKTTDRGTVLINDKELSQLQFLELVTTAAEMLYPGYGDLRRELLSRMGRQDKRLPVELLNPVR